MKNLQFYLLIGAVSLIICLSGCADTQKKPNPKLESIGLLRGELLLCSTEGFGDVSFALDCKYDTRKAFDLALSLLHSFEYAEAEKAFVKVIDADPECAMAYWGVAMSIYHELWAPPGPVELEKGSKLLEIAQSLPKTDRAQDYIDAMGVFYQDWESKDHRTRELLYEQKMEEVFLNDTTDIEAAVLYALAITSSADPNDKTYSNQLKSGAILDKLFKAYPNHPGIAHYTIHTYDYPEIASMALSTARRYAEIAPSSAHAQHMPSHIFTRLGLWEESISTNINSASSAVCYSESLPTDGHWAQEIHAMDYLVYAYLQKGDKQNVNEQHEYLKSMKKTFPQNDFAVAYSANAIPARIALETKQWDEAANLELPTLEFEWDDFPWEKSIMNFARALGFVQIGDVVSAERELETINSLHQQLLKSDDAQSRYKAGQVAIELETTKAWIALAKGNTEEALALMLHAAELESQTSKHPVTPGEVLPAEELLGDMLLTLKRPTEALEAYERNLNGHPNRFNGLYGAAVAAKESGNEVKAQHYFNELLRITANSNCDRPEIAEAKAYLSALEI